MTSVPRVELVYDPDCPNVERARAVLRAALSEAGIPEKWQEWERGAADTPGSLRELGSPSILVNGRDIGCDEGESVKADANSCRIYVDDSGSLSGAPSKQLILRALARERRDVPPK